MKNLLWFTILSLLIVLSTSCKKEPTCDCESHEDCIDEICVLRENTFPIGETYVTTDNPYYGVVETNSCIDTLLLSVQSNDKFSLWLNVPPVQNVAPYVLNKYSDTEYLLTIAAPLCLIDGLSRYADIHCKIFPDSVNMNLYFWTLDAVGVPIDSARVTLYK